MSELQQVIKQVSAHLARIEALTSAMQILPSTVVLSLGEAQQPIDAAQRAEAAEARVKELDGMLDMLPEYLEYWDACDGPALSLSEWYVYKDGYRE